MTGPDPIDRANALWTLGRLSSQDLPSVAWDALEIGFDGPALRRLAALNRPSYFEVGDLLSKALLEMSKSVFSKPEAAMLLAREIAQQVVAGHKDPLKGASEIWRLACQSDFPKEITLFGGLDQDRDIPIIREECFRLLHRS